MKKVLFMLLAAAALCACTKEPGYVIKGQVGNVNGEAVLSYELPDGTPVEMTAPVKNGVFSFKGSVSDVVNGMLKVTPEGGQPTQASLYVENAPLSVAINPDKVVDYGQYGGLVYRDCKVTGGPNNEFAIALKDAENIAKTIDEYKDLAEDYDKLGDMGYTDMAAYQAASQAFQEKYADKMQGYSEVTQKALRECIEKYTDVEAAANMYYVYNNQLPLDDFIAGFNHYSEKARNSFLAKAAREEIAARKATEPGAVAPDFTLNDLEGKPVTLSSLRGQYVIVDFWASWCKPCRAGMPAMKELYAKYHKKGLEIIGVSDDTDHNAWKKAVEQDQTPWIHVIDEFPVENKPARVGELYAVHYIPSYFLLDKEGKVIGKMEHEELEAKLAELLP